MFHNVDVISCCTHFLQRILSFSNISHLHWTIFLAVDFSKVSPLCLHFRTSALSTSFRVAQSKPARLSCCFCLNFYAIFWPLACLGLSFFTASVRRGCISTILVLQQVLNLNLTGLSPYGINPCDVQLIGSNACKHCYDLSKNDADDEHAQCCPASSWCKNASNQNQSKWNLYSICSFCPQPAELTCRSGFSRKRLVLKTRAHQRKSTICDVFLFLTILSALQRFDLVCQNFTSTLHGLFHTFLQAFEDIIRLQA